MSEQDTRFSDLVEIAKCSGDLKQNYGETKGALLTAWFALLAHLANRPQPVLRTGWLVRCLEAVVVLIGGVNGVARGLAVFHGQAA
ncbi:hypothetical protein [Bradyrhizobium sp. RT11b]|uniref:hypothetical protein n=1 Tax=Bradyrhizobium sp. RT11b TaxID=3156332 RepID=UPI0033994D0F